MNNIKDYENLNQKKVLLRLDLNVPLKNGTITDQTRINKTLPVIEFLLNKNCQIIIISHVGRPNGKIDKALSLRPICESLGKYSFSYNIHFHLFEYEFIFPNYHFKWKNFLFC